MSNKNYSNFFYSCSFSITSNFFCLELFYQMITVPSQPVFDRVLLIQVFCFSRLFCKERVYIKTVSIYLPVFIPIIHETLFLRSKSRVLQFCSFTKSQDTHFKSLKCVNRGSKQPLLKLDLSGEGQSYNNCFVDIFTVWDKYLRFQNITCVIHKYGSIRKGSQSGHVSY